MSDLIVPQNTSDRQLSMFDETTIQLDWVEDLMTELGGRITTILLNDEKVYLVSDWVYILSGSVAKNKAGYWKDLKTAMAARGIEDRIKTYNLPNPDANNRRMEFASPAMLIDIALEMDSHSEGVQKFKQRARNSVLFVEWAKRNPSRAQLLFAELEQQQEAQRQIDKHDQDVVSYQSKGFDRQKAQDRVETKETQKHLNATLQGTHKDHKPDYNGTTAAQNKALFDMTRRELIAYLGLSSTQAEKYRDYLSKYALQAVNLVNRAAIKKLTASGLPLTATEQQTIIRDIAREVAPLLRAIAKIDGEDFISGDPLDDNGDPIHTRQIRMLKDGK